MELKQRIIGIIVLISLAVIFIPFIFDSEPIEQTMYPVAQQIPTPSMTLPTTHTTKSTTEHRSFQMVKTSPPSDLSHEAWAIQLGSFTDRHNADDLVSQLRTKGFAAFIKSSDLATPNVNRVFIGPETDRHKADTIMQRVNKAFHMKSIVVRYHSLVNF